MAICITLVLLVVLGGLSAVQLRREARQEHAARQSLLAQSLAPLAAEIATLSGIRLRGLMTIPAPRATLAEQRQPFAQLAAMLDGLRQLGIDCDTLSMGMTQDLEAAVAEGATLLRIGTAIFGERT